MLLFLAFIAGLTATFLVKKLIVLTCRKAMHRGMYRIRPGGSNWSSIALEAWYFSVASGAFLSRLV